MKLTKIICSVLSIIMILQFAFISIYASVGAEDESKLWEERAQYLENWDNWKYAGELYDYYPMLSGPLTVLLYTDVADKLTYMKRCSEGGDMIGPEYLVVFGDFYIESPEISDIVKTCTTGPAKAVEVRSALRECVRFFDISREELLSAYKTMKEDPDAIRPILSMLSDDEYQQLKKEVALGYDNGTFGKTEWPDFIIDALYMQDDCLAQKLLCKPFAVYVKELDRVVNGKELFWHFSMSVEAFAQYDLTASDMGAFLTYCRDKYLDVSWDDAEDGRTVLEKIEYLESAREKQLSAKAGREAAFIGELGSMLTAERLFGTAEEAPTVTVAELAVCDLTGEDMGNFLVYLRENIESYESTADPADGRTPLEKLEYLEAQREAQLKAAETGDGMEKAFLAVGIGIGALVLLAIVRKKRKI